MSILTPFSITDERRHALLQEIQEISLPSASYYLRVALSTTIATFGLLANSAPVVIGAMLVAPLMGPIFGVALGLSAGHRKLTRLSFTSEIFGALLAFAIAAGVGLVPLQLGLGTEVLSRTQPTLYDLVVALASGLAGAYALVDEKLSASLPGVAISTALVPPLATSGLCFSTGHMDWAIGSFLLFLANFVAIQIAASGVFVVSGLARVSLAKQSRLLDLLRQFGISLVALVLIGSFLTATLIDLVAHRRLHSGIVSELSEQVRRSTGAALDEVTFELERDSLEVVASVTTPQEFTPQQVAKFEQALRRNVHPKVHLIVRSIISRDVDRDGAVYVARKTVEGQESVNRQTVYLRTATELLGQKLRLFPGASLADLRLEEGGDAIRLVAVVRSPVAIGPEHVADLQRALAETLGVAVSLVIRTVFSRDADAARFLYDPPQESSTPRPDQLERRRKIEQLLRSELESQPGRRLIELLEFEEGGATVLVARTSALAAIAPAEVERIQDRLRRETSPEIALVIRYEVGADVAALGLAVEDENGKPRPPRSFETDEFREQLRFGSQRADLTRRASALLRVAAREVLGLLGDRQLVIEGYSDSLGPELLNRSLSLRRAEVVRDFLISSGVPADRLRAEGLGSLRPVGSNATADGRTANRRVELRLEAPRDTLQSEPSAPAPTTDAGDPPPT